MRTNTVKAKLRAGEPTVGVFCNIPSAASVEMLGYMGFDFAIVDAEHGPMDLETNEEMIRAADATGIVPIVRVALNAPQNTLRYLDAGALGVQMPMVNTAEEARRVVDSTKFPPVGRRGLAVTRAAGYGVDGPLTAYVERANEETLVIVQVETREALANVAEIAAVDMVDMVFLGPTDLSAALGVPGQPTHPDVMAAIEEAGKVVQAAGKATGTIARDATAYAHWRERGFLYLATGLTNFIAAAGQEFLGGVRAYDAGRVAR